MDKEYQTMVKPTDLQFSITKCISRVFFISLFLVCITFLITLQQVGRNTHVIYGAEFLNISMRGSFRYNQDNTSSVGKIIPKEIGEYSVLRQSSETTISNFTKDTVQCKPRTKVAFLKVHKAGSTTVMNIFLRYGDSHKLNIVLPKSPNQSVFNYLGYGSTIQTKRIHNIPNNETYSILCNHVVYNKVAFKKVLGPTAINIGIIRDPFTHFPSAAFYYGLISRLQRYFKKKMNVQELLSAYLKNPSKIGHAKHTHNGMFADFGLPSRDFDNESVINKHLTDLDSDFALVMLTEMFDESLILMRRILCWSIKDILYVSLNINKKKEKQPIVLPEQTKRSLFKYNYADFKLYLFFRRKLLKQIANAGKNFDTEVIYFKKINKLVTQYCHTNQLRKFVSFPPLEVESSAWNDKFTITPEECKFMMSAELPLLKQLIKKADDHYNNWSRSKNQATNMSPILGRNKIS